MRIYLEIFGYIGTALVLLSMLMTEIKWLRAINMAGSLISFIYALCTFTMPIAVMNGALLIINGVQLTRLIIADRNRAEGMSCAADTYSERENMKERVS